MTAPSNKSELEALREEVEALRAELADAHADSDELRTALCECAESSFPDINALSPVNPLSGSAHVRQKLFRYAPTLSPMVERHLAGGNSPQASVKRIEEQMQKTHAQAERGRSEGAAFDRHREGKAAMYAKAREEGRLT